jgi:DNA-binding transcriptional regulator YiaG
LEGRVQGSCTRQSTCLPSGNSISDFGITTGGKIEVLRKNARGDSLKNREYVKQYRSFLKLLRQARQDSGFTQARVAKLMGHPQSFVSKFESGERRVDFVELQILAKIYKKPLSFFQAK